MSICNILDLGCFDKCNEVIINLIIDGTEVVNTRNGISFVADGSNLGLLNPGVYCFTRSDQRYQFIVKDTADCSSFTPELPPDGVYLDIRATRFGDQLQETGLPGSVPRTPVTSLSQPVGLIYDRGSNVLALTSGSANKPNVEAFGALAAAWNLSSPASAITYNFQTGAANPFRFFHGVDNSYSMRMKIGLPAGSDGVNKTIITTNGAGNSTTTGILFRKGSGNTIQAFCQRGTSGTSKFGITHSEVVNDNDVVSIVLQIDGTGPAAGSLTVNGVTETFEVLTGVDSAPSPNNGIVIGGSTAAVSDEIYLQDLFISQTLMSPAEISAYTSTIFLIDASDMPPVARMRYNAEDTSFALNASDLPASEGEEVKTLLNQISNLFPVDVWQFENTSAGERPVMRIASQAGENILEYDGSNDELIAQRSIIPHTGGNWSMFFVAFNQDSADGSHVMSGTLYFAFTGEDYVGAFSEPYGVAHFAVQPPAVLATDTANNVEAYCLKRQGTTVKLFNANGDVDEKTGVIEAFDLENIGRPSGGGGFLNWWLDGLLCHIEQIVGVLPDEDCIKYTKQLRDKFRT
jgi:hypothetical protein